MAAAEPFSRMHIQTIGGENIVDFFDATLPDVPPPHGDFDPREHRHPGKPISRKNAYINLLKTMFGAGMLAMPLATSYTGLILGPVLIIITAALVLYSHHSLLWSLNEISRQLNIPYVPYASGARIAYRNGPPIFQVFSNCILYIVGALMVLGQLGICTVLVIFTSDNLRDLMDWDDSKYAILILLIPYMIMEYFMKNLKIISHISMAGNILCVIGFTFVCYHLFQPKHSVDLILANSNMLAFHLAYGTYLFNISALAVVLALEKQMQNPKMLTQHPFGLLNIGIAVPSFISILFSTLGYWSFGTMEQNILRSLPLDEWTSQIAIASYLIAIAFSFPIHCYSAQALIMTFMTNAFDLHYNASERGFLATVIRPIFVLLCFAMCWMFPVQTAFVAVVGNVITFPLIIGIPATMEYCILHPDSGPYRIYLIKMVVFTIASFYSSIHGFELTMNMLLTLVEERRLKSDNIFL